MPHEASSSPARPPPTVKGDPMSPIVLLAASFGVIIVAGTAAAWVHDVLAARFRTVGATTRGDVATVARTSVRAGRTWGPRVTSGAREVRVARPFRRRPARPAPRRAVRTAFSSGTSGGRIGF